MSVIVDGQSGKLLKITNLEKSINVNINHEMAYYISATGDNRHDNTQASGAYTFRPNGTEPRRFNQSLTVQSVIKQVRCTLINKDISVNVQITILKTK